MPVAGFETHYYEVGNYRAGIDALRMEREQEAQEPGLTNRSDFRENRSLIG